MNKYDTIIIGFGKAGKTIAGKLAKSGQKVALIEKDAAMYGGTCINVGCIPSKRLVTDAENAPAYDFEEQEKYYEKAIREKRELTAALRKANYGKVVQAGAEIIDGEASFTGNKTLEVKTAEGSIELSADRFVINTGSTPVLPDIEGAKESDSVYFSETLMDLDKLPERLTILGGGYIGLEFASMYANFGSKVTILQDGEVFLPREDEDIASSIRGSLEAKGVKIITGGKTYRITEGDLYYKDAEGEKKLEGDAILIAAGRRPNTDDLNAEKAGVKLNDRGAVITDEHLRTSAKNIWAAGDVCGKLMFTYISLDDSRIILGDMSGIGERTTENRGAFSYSVFIDPPFSRAGLSENDAVKQGINYRSFVMKTEAIPKAKVLRKTTGMLKAIVDSDTEAVIGAELFCPASHEIINMFKLAIDLEISYKVLKEMIYTHPTISEGLNDLFA